MEKIKIALIVLIFLISPNMLLAQMEIIESKDLSIGETIKFHSKILNEERSINVYLPLHYQREALNEYPVIYVLDGGLDEDFLHITGIVQFGTFSWINMLPESIVIGITNIDRKRDFTFPTQNILDLNANPTTGHSTNFMKFIQNELQPFINSRYGTNNSNTIIGQSLGGLLATEILFTNPDLFDNYIIVSPSLWWDDESLLSENLATIPSSKSIYIAVGKEGEVMERTAKDLYEKIKKNSSQATKVHFQFLEDQKHNDALHLAVYNAFEILFSK